MERVFVIKDGVVTSLYTEEIDLRALGTLHVERASNVEWDDNAQGWVVTLANGSKPLYEVFRTRDEAIAAEVEYLQAHL